MRDTISGIHHVTAIGSDPQKNFNFYVGVLGLRLIKKTVNFDDPGTYHLYYGDGAGNPGTIMTFFPWPGAVKGVHGVGETTTVSFAVPAGSIQFWEDRLNTSGISIEGPFERFGEQYLSFDDHDGTHLELVVSKSIDKRSGWDKGGVQAEFAIRGFHAITISEEGYHSTAELLTEGMDFRHIAEEGNRFRFQSHGDSAASIVDIVCLPESNRGTLGAGSVHHVAFRVVDDASQLRWRTKLIDIGRDVTPVMDRNYFHSIYFREPGGVIFEIATDNPGFMVDESFETLGQHLKLPDWYEVRRSSIEKQLLPINL